MSALKTEYLEMQEEEVEFTPQYADHESSQHNDGEFANSNVDEELLRRLLHRFDMESLMPFLKASDITYRSLRYLSVDDINAAIRSVGQRAEFREKLFAWRSNKFKSNEIFTDCDQITDLTIDDLPVLPTTITKVNLKKRPRSVSPTGIVESEPETLVMTPQYEIKKSKTRGISLQWHRKNLDLNAMLDQSHFGPQLKAFYHEHGFLERKHRDEIIQIVINYVCVNSIKLHARDFVILLNDIVDVFPNEEEARDYYFIDRIGRRNPTGRLYTKYYNTLKRSKLKKSLVESAGLFCDFSNASVSTPQQIHGADGVDGGDHYAQQQQDDDDHYAQQLQDDDDEEGGGISITDAEVAALDEPSLNAIKSFLRCDGIDWDDVCTMWVKTYTARRADTKRLDIKDVLQQWPKYLGLKGADLFAIDFKWMYPFKCELLPEKWAEFKTKIYSYYHLNIKDEWCKGIFLLAKSNPSKIVEEYLLLILLNAILPPTARFRDKSGRLCRKASIVDACEWFAMRVSSLDKLMQRKQEIQCKYNITNSELHSSPSIVVVGENNISLQAIYVSFDTAMYRVPDLLSAVAVCLHIFHVLAIPYSPFNEFPWTFIQRFLYGIIRPEDAKCPSLSSLCTYLKY